MRKTILTGAIACAIAPAFAEDTPTTFDLGMIVVTATRIPTPVRELLNDISVITEEEIQRAGQATLPELLRTLPGVEFSANGGAGTNSSVFIRGANANHTLVLIDGMRINSATSGTTALEKIPLGQIERIEVLRGPGSHLYGSEAIGGVIQIFTKSGGATPGFHFGGGVGSRGLHQANAGGNGKLGEVSFNLEVANESTDSFSALGNPAHTFYNADNDPYRNTSVNGKLGYTLAPGHELSLTGFHSVGRTHYDSKSTTPSIPASFDFRNEQTLSSYALQSRNQFRPEWQSTLRIGTSTDDLRTATLNSHWDQIRTDQDQVLWQNDITTRIGVVTLGAEHLDQQVTSNTVYAVTHRTVMSYLTGYRGKFDAHSLQLNLRHDDNSQFGGHLTKSLAYGYQLNREWRGTASIGTAFNAPTFNNLYYPGGNPNLKPETAINRELSLHHERGSRHASLTVFDNRINQLITYSGTTPVQIQSARITGAALAYQARFDEYGVHASATWQDPRNETSKLLLNRRAKQTATAGIDRQWNAWNFGSDVVAAGKRFDDTNNTKRMGGYTVFNLNAANRYSKDLSFLARLNNAFNKQYELARDYNTPDRNVFIGFDYHPQ
ncbi:MAG: TonB-dependent receptor [Hydrogenophilales bacterium]|nr:TonB-dependent receptor [Hydrogenophilales bacterium]